MHQSGGISTVISCFQAATIDGRTNRGDLVCATVNVANICAYLLEAVTRGTGDDTADRED
jgi:hypothetical protein